MKSDTKQKVIETKKPVKKEEIANSEDDVSKVIEEVPKEVLIQEPKNVIIEEREFLFTDGVTMLYQGKILKFKKGQKALLSKDLRDILVIRGVGRDA